MRDRTSSNGLANVITLLGIGLVLVAGVTAYPAIRGWLGLDAEPEGFGDENTLSASIVELSESVPPDASGAQPASDPVPVVLPETPLESEVTPDSAAPPVEPTPAPTEAPAAPPVGSSDTGSASFEPALPTRLVIPAIDLDAPVDTVGWSVTTAANGQQISMWDVPNHFAAGWLKTTARLGEPGNTVLDGHHNMAGEVFRDLVNLKQGDALTLWAGDRPRAYVVSMLKILPEKGQQISVRLENAKWIQPTKDERVTLITCWPYENNTHRLIVVAQPVQPTPDDLGIEQ